MNIEVEIVPRWVGLRHALCRGWLSIPSGVGSLGYDRLAAGYDWVQRPAGMLWLAGAVFAGGNLFAAVWFRWCAPAAPARTLRLRRSSLPAPPGRRCRERGWRSLVGLPCATFAAPSITGPHSIAVCPVAPTADSDRMFRQFGQPMPVTLGQAGDNRGVLLLIAGILNPDDDFAMLVL